MSQQQEMPFGLVYGNKITKIPDTLYIPPDALQIFIDTFEGPLDLLLYLIRKQNIDILEIDIADITGQYMQYVEAMESIQLELAAEYMLMAALLAEIKSKMLLPQKNETSDEEQDPRASLMLRLLEYERFKSAANNLDDLPQVGREYFPVNAFQDVPIPPRQMAQVDVKDLILAFSAVLKRAHLNKKHTITREQISTRVRMSYILDCVNKKGFTTFESLFDSENSHPLIIVTFLALMELIKSALVDVVQNTEFGSIHIKLSR